MNWKDILKIDADGVPSQSKKKKTISPQGKEMLGGTFNQRKHSLSRFYGADLRNMKTLEVYEDRLTGASFIKLSPEKYVVTTQDDKESTFKTKKQMINYLNALAGNR